MKDASFSIIEKKLSAQNALSLDLYSQFVAVLLAQTISFNALLFLASSHGRESGADLGGRFKLGISKIVQKHMRVCVIDNLLFQKSLAVSNRIADI